jgi:PEGA domain
MTPINSRKSKGLKRITMVAAAAFVLALGTSPVLGQRSGGAGRVGGGNIGHVGGGMGGGHAMRGGPPQGAGAEHPQRAGGGRQGPPKSGPGGDARPHSNPNAVKGDGRGGDHHDHGHHFDHGDHDRDFPRGFFYYDPYFWGWGYPYPSYPYLEYPWYPDGSDRDPTYGLSIPTYNSPSETEKGGISFAVTPADALVYVDDHYVGMASSFGSDSQPLSLAAGSHRIELLATGFEAVSFEVNVVAGQVIPYRVSLKPRSDR